MGRSCREGSRRARGSIFLSRIEQVKTDGARLGETSPSPAPNSGWPEFGILSQPKPDKSDLDWKASCVESAQARCLEHKRACVPRATNVNFSVTVGTTVPTSVRVVAVPQVLVDIYPDYRGHMYFVVGDEIIIVDRNHRIIAVIAV